MGRKILLRRKSSKFKMVPPKTFSQLQFHSLNPKAQGTDKMKILKRFRIQDFLRDILNVSIIMQTIFSKTEKIVLKAAKDRNRKNKPPQKRPICILAKTLGRVMKTKLGPAPTFTL